MPKLTKKEGLFLSRLQDQSGRLAIAGNKYDRLIKAGYVLPERDSFSPNTIHYTLTETGRRVLEISQEENARGIATRFAKTHQRPSVSAAPWEEKSWNGLAGKHR